MNNDLKKRSRDHIAFIINLRNTWTLLLFNFFSGLDKNFQINHFNFEIHCFLSDRKQKLLQNRFTLQINSE